MPVPRPRVPWWPETAQLLSDKAALLLMPPIPFATVKPEMPTVPLVKVKTR